MREKMRGIGPRPDRTEEGTGQFIDSSFASVISPPARRTPRPESPRNSTWSSMRRRFLCRGIRGLVFCTSLSSSRLTTRFGNTPRPVASRATRLPRMSRPILRVRELIRVSCEGEVIVTRVPSGCNRRVEKSWTVLRRRVVGCDIDEQRKRPGPVPNDNTINQPKKTPSSTK